MSGRSLSAQAVILLWAAVVLWASLFVSEVNLKAQAPGRTSAGPQKAWFTFSAEEALKGQLVGMEGTVLCYDPGWGQFYIHEGEYAVYLNPRSFTNEFRVGQQIRIAGTTTWDGTVPVLTNASATVIGRKPLPRALPLKLADLAKAHGQWVEVQGRVQVAEASRERVTLVIQDGGHQCLVYVMQTSSASRFRYLADCRVRIQGINASRIRNGSLEAGILFCPGMDQVTVTSPASKERRQIPVTPIEMVLTRKLGSWTNEPVHIAGELTAYQPGESATIKDPTGVLGAEVIQVTPVPLFQRVELWGFLTTRSNRTVLANAYFDLLSRPATDTPAKSTPASESATEVAFTEIKQVRSLSKTQANQHRLARVRGVLTFVDTDWRLAFLQNGSEAIFFDTGQKGLEAGQYVEVTGETDGSGFAPQLSNCSVSILGTTNWPTPISVDVQASVSGHLDSRWVQVEGVVRRVRKESGRISLVIAGPGGRVGATVLDLNDSNAPAELVDSLVSVRGACGSTVNSRGQISGITLHVPSRREISVLDKGPAAPFQAPPMAISQVATFDPSRLAGRRVRVSGVVTLTIPGLGLFLQDGSGGIRILGEQAEGFHPGDRLDVLAFPALRDFSPCLEEATIRRLGKDDLPAAKAIAAARILQEGICDGLRTELKAQVLQSLMQGAQSRLLLQDGSVIFTAQIIQPRIGQSIRELNPGSLVKVRGVCVIQGTENNEPGSFRILVDNAADVILIKAGPWWTPRRTLTLLGGIGVAALLAAAWVFSMRRQIGTQTEIIRRNQEELLETSRQAGMAEVATSVLHNVGNVLNSVNVSATLVADQVKQSRVSDVARIATMLQEHSADLGGYLMGDPKGRLVPPYLDRLGTHLAQEQTAQIAELEVLRKNIDHIKDIVAMQQSFGRVSGVTERVKVTELVEDAIQLNQGALERHRVRIVREYQPRLPLLTTERHKVLQILVNLIANAKNACCESGLKEKSITLTVRHTGEQIRISVADNGIGILPENLTRIFSLGFTTRKDGHGFGLHSGALAAKELGGRLLVESAGQGKGATFTLELPNTS